MHKNKFAITPPMGWNSYDYYDTTVTEEQVKANADYMAKNLKEYGWEYVVVDIEWYSNDAGTQRDKYQYIPFGDDQMDEWGRFQPSPSRFPSSADGTGFTALAEYVHNLGLKFGIHIMRGIPRKAAEKHCPILGTDVTADVIADPSSICGWNPDMYGVRDMEAGQAYYDSIIQMYANWGVDFIKCDDICDSWLYRGDNFSGWHETEMLHKAIMKCGRPIVLSLSPGPAHIDRAWQYCKYANMWRITDDFWDTWDLLKNMFWRCEMWQDHVGEGCFPDCDMLPLGKLGGGFGHGEWDCRFSKEEQRTMMTLWCMFRSPLMVGAELTKMDDWTLSLLTNKELLALLDENCHGIQLVRNDKVAVWKNKNSKTGELHVALFNLSDADDTISITLEELEEELDEQTAYTLHEIWDKTETKTIDGRITAVVPAHGVKVYSIGSYGSHSA
ncbi:MAG: glycoside hydrolase family 27 protein [Lachnospiraceae bacterium]|nr:glycoside hydrolase family 27 protein [Lachnospiraceae bacterium]